MLTISNSNGATVSNCIFNQDKTVDPQVLSLLKDIAKGYIKMLDVLQENMDTKKAAITFKGIDGGYIKNNELYK